MALVELLRMYQSTKTLWQGNELVTAFNWIGAFGESAVVGMGLSAKNGVYLKVVTRV